ncbi:MAG: HAMP domain-containing histidine kinase [Planctomycetales bacterium]|nr:HAMP domain-containing histidine kinase [Planctomycetales bacterium]
MKGISIRWQLTLAFAFFMMLTMVLLCTLVLWRVHSHLHFRADRGLQEELDELVEELSYFHERELLVAELERRFKTHSHYYFQILDDEFSLVFASRFLTNIHLPEPTERPSSMRGKNFQDIELEGLGDFRLLSMAIRDGEAQPLLLQAIESREELKKDFLGYIWMFVTIVPVAIIGALTGGYFLSGRILIPIKRINLAAQEITAEQISRRLSGHTRNDELGELSRTLNATFDRLEKSIVAMRRFTSDAAHELRSPVAALRTEAEIALRKPRGVEEYQQVIESTLKEALRLECIVDQLLTLSRHDSGVEVLLDDEVPVGAVVKDVAARLALMAEQKGVQLHVHELPEAYVPGHDVRLSQLFFNLIDNALKFTSTGGHVWVSGRIQGSQIEIQVSDTGIGMNEEQLSRVFDRFFRADTARQHFAGTGLGLAICKSIVNAHGGEIRAESKLGNGTSFLVTLPIVEHEPESQPSRSIESQFVSEMSGELP